MSYASGQQFGVIGKKDGEIITVIFHGVPFKKETPKMTGEPREMIAIKQERKTETKERESME